MYKVRLKQGLVSQAGEYAKGDIIDVDEMTAKRMVARGYAEEVEGCPLPKFAAGEREQLADGRVTLVKTIRRADPNSELGFTDTAICEPLKVDAKRQPLRQLRKRKFKLPPIETPDGEPWVGGELATAAD